MSFGLGPNHRGNGSFVFRGQGNAEHVLLPTRFREYANGAPVPTVVQQVERELEETRRFFDMADDHGLQIPGDSQELRWVLTDPYVTPHQWPEPRFWSLLAVAQHYGLPTRFLDWSRSARVGAYFAASRATERLLKRDGEATNLVVWVLSLTEFHNIRSDPNGDARWREFPFQFVTAPGYSNRNLSAQRGCFTLYQPPLGVMDVDKPLDIQPLDEVYERFIVKVTLPVAQAPKLLWLLARDGVTAASIFPGYAGVVRALAEERMVKSLSTQ